MNNSICIKCKPIINIETKKKRPKYDKKVLLLDIQNNLCYIDIIEKYGINPSVLSNFVFKNKAPSVYDYLFKKMVGFFRNGKFTFRVSDLLQKIGPDPKCYLSGRKIDLCDISSYSLDHKIPLSKSGDNSIENCEICLKMINIMKLNFDYSEFISVCKDISKYNGH